MNYQKHFLYSLIFALIIGIISYFIFGYLPYDCSQLDTLNSEQRLECHSAATLGLGYWLPFSLFSCCVAVLAYWAVYLASGLIRRIFCKK